MNTMNMNTNNQMIINEEELPPNFVSMDEILERPIPPDAYIGERKTDILGDPYTFSYEMEEWGYLITYPFLTATNLATRIDHVLDLMCKKFIFTKKYLGNSKWKIYGITIDNTMHGNLFTVNMLQYPPEHPYYGRFCIEYNRLPSRFNNLIFAYIIHFMGTMIDINL